MSQLQITYHIRTCRILFCTLWQIGPIMSSSWFIFSWTKNLSVYFFIIMRQDCFLYKDIRNWPWSIVCWCSSSKVTDYQSENFTNLSLDLRMIIPVIVLWTVSVLFERSERKLILKVAVGLSVLMKKRILIIMSAGKMEFAVNQWCRFLIL